MPGLVRRLAAAAAVVLVVLAGGAPAAHASTTPRSDRTVAAPGQTAGAQHQRVTTQQEHTHPAIDLDHQLVVLTDTVTGVVTEQIDINVAPPRAGPAAPAISASVRGPPVG